MEANLKKPSGLLHTKSRSDKSTLDLYLPTPELELYVEHYWIVNWDLRGQEPYVSENLPHPSVHLVIERDQSQIVGVIKEKFARRLEDKGFVFGIKFRPGAFYPFVNSPVYKFTGRTMSAHEVFGADFSPFEDAIRAMNDQAGMVELAEAFLRKRLPVHDETVAQMKSIIDSIISDRKITAVEDVADRFQISTRMLQRLFRKYVGVSLKWVIQRYRLLEVADQLANGPPQSWPELAIELGYYDQSHFIKDFKGIVGLSPEEYVRKNSANSDRQPASDR